MTVHTEAEVVRERRRGEESAHPRPKHDFPTDWCLAEELPCSPEPEVRDEVLVLDVGHPAPGPERPPRLHGDSERLAAH